MRRLLLLFLLVVFTFNSVGYYFVFKVLQEQVRSEVKSQFKQQIPESRLHLVTIKETDARLLEWEREGKEFRYKGMMYDVVRTVKQEGAVSYYCMTDVEESRLYTMLELLVKEQLSHSKKHDTAKKLLKNFLNKLFIDKYSIEIKLFQAVTSTTLPFEESLQSLALDVIAPPPKLI